MARSIGIDVVSAGVHLSSHGPSVDFLTSCGVSVGIGEVDPLFDRIVADALDGALAPLYRINEGHGLRWFTFTDDNFIQNPRHLEILESVPKCRTAGRNFAIGLILDVESSCYADEQSPRDERTRRFLALGREAGVSNVFIALESTNDASPQQVAKQVNRDRKAKEEDAHRAILERYLTAFRAWQAIGASVECGYLLGFDADGPGESARAAPDMVAIGIDIVSFYLLTPLTGAEARQRWLDGHVARRPSVLPATMLDDSRMESLPILRHHALWTAALRSRA